MGLLVLSGKYRKNAMCQNEHELEKVKNVVYSRENTHLCNYNEHNPLKNN